MVKKKTNQLNKRFLRELKSEAGKYIVLFVFIAGVIALVSGFLVASGSMSQAYDESFEKYNIEDGGNSMAKMTVYHGGNTSRKKHKRFWNGVLLYGYKGTGSKMGEKI